MKVTRKNGCTIGMFSCEMYPSNYDVYIGNLRNCVAIYLAKYPDLKENFNESHIESCGMYFHDLNRNIGAIFLESNYDKYTLAHECSHAVHHLFKGMGALSVGWGNEPEAYCLCWLMEKCDQINKLGKKRR